MPPQANDLLRPFSRDRTETPKENGAASQALKRLMTIKSFLVQPFFDDFKCKKDDEILDFNPRSDFQLRIELEKLKREMRGLLDTSFWCSRGSLHSELEKLVNSVNREDEVEQAQVRQRAE